MSGRKDFTYALNAERLAKLIAENQARVIQRSTDTKKRLSEAKATSQTRIVKLQKEMRERTNSRLSAASKRSVEMLSNSSIGSDPNVKINANKAIKRANQLLESAQELGLEESIFHEFSANLASVDILDEVKLNQILDSLSIACQEQTNINRKLEAQVDLLIRWQDNLRRSEESQTFASSRCSQWSSMVELIVHELKSRSATSEILNQVESAILDAESIASEAGEIADMFHARNSVITDIIESMKELGFFVQDPAFANVDQPGGAVVIQASRGGQTMTAQVDLNAQVQSEWQGVNGNYCTDAFFDYVKAMDKRGVEITSADPTLVPRLLVKGEREIPTQDKRSKGSDL